MRTFLDGSFQSILSINISLGIRRKVTIQHIFEILILAVYLTLYLSLELISDTLLKIFIKPILG
jgi:hypothetical protein